MQLDFLFFSEKRAELSWAASVLKADNDCPVAGKQNLIHKSLNYVHSPMVSFWLLKKSLSPNHKEQDKRSPMIPYGYVKSHLLGHLIHFWSSSPFRSSSMTHGYWRPLEDLHWRCKCSGWLRWDWIEVIKTGFWKASSVPFRLTAESQTICSFRQAYSHFPWWCFRGYQKEQTEILVISSTWSQKRLRGRAGTDFWTDPLKNKCQIKWLKQKYH